MSAPPTVVPVRKASAARAILWGGTVIGVLDILSAFLSYGIQFGTTPVRVLQSVAGGWLGKATYQGGAKTALLGLLTHFFIATMVAAVYWFASRRLRFLVEHAVICGLVYGFLVYVVMQEVVVPLSAIHSRSRMTWAKAISGPLGHPLLVGLPAALIARRFSERREDDE